MRDTAKPLYEAVKDYVRGRIDAGDWEPGARIPSENELGPMLGVSRITINRAFKELADEGRLRKVAGVGTFVAERKPRFGLMTIDSIAAEIAARGMSWSCEVLVLDRRPATAETAAPMNMQPGAPVFHSVILHRGDTTPIQIEERFVRPDHAPAYLEQDYRRGTTSDHLRRTSDVHELEQSITAIAASRVTASRLDVAPGAPCLLIRRRTFRDGLATTLSLLTQPGGRFELSQRMRMHLPARRQG